MNRRSLMVSSTALALTAALMLLAVWGSGDSGQNAEAAFQEQKAEPTKKGGKKGKGNNKKGKGKASPEQAAQFSSDPPPAPGEAGVPVLSYVRTAYTKERPVRLTKTVFAGDRNRLVYELGRLEALYDQDVA